MENSCVGLAGDRLLHHIAELYGLFKKQMKTAHYLLWQEQEVEKQKL